MVNYGSVDYWNRRYNDSVTSDPFDWLFDYNDVSVVLHEIIHDKSLPILMVGAGNAPFSIDMYHKGKYTDITNIDISDVVINRQKEVCPEEKWMIMDVKSMDFNNNTFPYVIDKSLIDTLLCYEENTKSVSSMITEIYRVMDYGSRYITFSLHSLEETIVHFQGYDWKVTAHRVKSNRWNDGENSKRAVAHVMVICDKPLKNGLYQHQYPLQLSGVLQDDEYEKLERYAIKVNTRKAVQLTSIDVSMDILDRVLKMHLTKGSGSSSSSSDTDDAPVAAN